MEVPDELGVKLVLVHTLVAGPVIEMHAVRETATILAIVSGHHVAYNHVGRITEEGMSRLVPNADGFCRYTHNQCLGGRGRLLDLLLRCRASVWERLLDATSET